MERLLIYELDLDKEPISTLEIGEYVFGRGSLLKCDDRRVSRNHGKIKITEKIATIASTHQNPCFYQAANSSTITILPKDTPVNVNDGDKFALLADKYWFRIKIPVASDNLKNELEDSAYVRKENGYHEPTTSFAKASNFNGEGEDIDGDNKLWLNSFDFAGQKRNHENEVETSNIKKAKYENNDETAEEDQLLSVLSDLKKREENEDENATSESVTKKAQISDSEDDINVKIPESEDKQKTAVSNAPKPRKRNVKATAAMATQNDHDGELKTMLFSSDEEAEPEIKTDDVLSANTKKEDESDKNKINSDGSNKDGNDDTNATGSNKDGNDDTNAAGTSRSEKRVHRDHCWYGLNCYRKNPAHLAEYSHPGDSDYESDPEDDRPICSFGAACYRRSKDHRQAYRHPSKPQKPAGKKADKTKDDTTNGDSPKKRTTRKKYYDTPEDDYDLDDPFLNDSSTDYEVSSDEEDDSGSEGSGGESEEETKRMLREAKKFTKGKK